jgi:anti-sigma factor RsiW
MSGGPVLVYGRIDTNRRRTRLLLGSFGLALLPVVSGAAAFVMPFVSLMGGAVMYAMSGTSATTASLESLEARLASASAGTTYGLLGVPLPYLIVFGASWQLP